MLTRAGMPFFPSGSFGVSLQARLRLEETQVGVTINLMTKWPVLIAAAGLCFVANAAVSLTGVVGDDMCGIDHKKMGGTDAAKCAAECAKGMGAKYSLIVGNDTYVLSDQAAGAKYAGKKVTVTGDVTTSGAGKDTVKSLKIKSISAAR
jgi:hypothetical protein